ncbi:hypothetical protein D3C81_1661590 [compost metagenome]
MIVMRGPNLSNSLPEIGAMSPFTNPPGSRIKPDLNAVTMSTPCINIGSMIAEEKNVIISTSISATISVNVGYRKARKSITGSFNNNCLHTNSNKEITPAAIVQTTAGSDQPCTPALLNP